MTFGQGTMINSYRVLTPIGSGGMGDVYLAEEAILGRKVAIKVLNPLLTREEQFKQRFINEAKIQASLQHPNIVGLYSFFDYEDNYYMALEYAEGKTLKDIIAETGPMPEARVRKILQQILNALQYAHGKGIIHRDIKPSNIMVDGNDTVKIMDFGIARIMEDSHLTRTGLKVGTLYYMSPEQIVTPKEVDNRTDIYSTGIVLYEMLTGQLPFNTDTESDFVIQKEIVDNRFPDPRSFYPHVSEYMTKLIFSMTDKDRDKRSIYSVSKTAIEPIPTGLLKRQSRAHPGGKAITKNTEVNKGPSYLANSDKMFHLKIVVFFSVISFFPLGLAALSERHKAISYLKEGNSAQATKSFHQARVLSSIGIVLGMIMLFVFRLMSEGLY